MPLYREWTFLTQVDRLFADVSDIFLRIRADEDRFGLTELNRVRKEVMYGRILDSRQLPVIYLIHFHLLQNFCFVLVTFSTQFILKRIDTFYIH
jgi:hypothetical protein